MKHATKRMIAALLLIGSCIAGVGCGKERIYTKESAAADCIVAGKKIYFVDEKQRQEWEEPLAKLLSNVIVAYGEGGEIMGEEPVDPNSPAIPQSYACGLLDINMDGTPELLVQPFGYYGSSGCATYFAYDIYTGEKIGSIDSGGGESWCVHYNMQTDTLQLIGQYWLRYGWPERERYVDKVGYNAEVELYTNLSYLRTYHVIDGWTEDIVDIDPDDGLYTATWVEDYPDTVYYVNGAEVYLDEYYAEYDAFVQNNIRIPETDFQLFRWDDVSEDEDSYAEKGQKMAHALINSDQMFILYQ